MNIVILFAFKLREKNRLAFEYQFLHKSLRIKMWHDDDDDDDDDDDEESREISNSVWQSFFFFFFYFFYFCFQLIIIILNNWLQQKWKTTNKNWVKNFLNRLYICYMVVVLVDFEIYNWLLNIERWKEVSTFFFLLFFFKFQEWIQRKYMY